MLFAPSLQRASRLALEIDDHELPISRLQHLPKVVVAVVTDARPHILGDFGDPPIHEPAYDVAALEDRIDIASDVVGQRSTRVATLQQSERAISRPTDCFRPCLHVPGARLFRSEG